jgi:hypothetical protein
VMPPCSTTDGDALSGASRASVRSPMGTYSRSPSPTYCAARACVMSGATRGDVRALLEETHQLLRPPDALLGVQHRLSPRREPPGDARHGEHDTEEVEG